MRENLNIVAISIVLYKTPQAQLEKCLNSILRFHKDFLITIIDNSPSICVDLKNFPNIILIHNPENPGYGKSHNIAISKSINTGFKYHVVINADVYFENDIFNFLIEFMNNNVRVGILAPKVLNPNGSIQYLCKLVPTPFDLLARILFPKFMRNKLNDRFELRFSGYNRLMFVPYLSGCFMFMRVEAIKEVGMFDERFFMYPEDIDLTRRMAVKFETIFVPDVSIYHEYGGASKKSLRMFFVHAINIFRYFNKWGWFMDKERLAINSKTLFLLSK